MINPDVIRSVSPARVARVYVRHRTPKGVQGVVTARAINMALLSECPRHPVRGVIFIEDGAKENLHSFRSAMLTT